MGEGEGESEISPPSIINISLSKSEFVSNTLQETQEDTKAADICDALSYKLNLSGDDAKFFTLVLVVTLMDSSTKKASINYLRTLHSKENVMKVERSLLAKLVKRYKLGDDTIIKETVRWYYKVRLTKSNLSNTIIRKRPQTNNTYTTGHPHSPVRPYE